jgi:hypothetical protein
MSPSAARNDGGPYIVFCAPRADPRVQIYISRVLIANLLKLPRAAVKEALFSFSLSHSCALLLLLGFFFHMSSE